MKSKDFQLHLKQLSQSIKSQIDAHYTGWDDQPTAIEQRRAKVFDAVNGFVYFVKNYFPHYLRHQDQSQLHEYLFGELPAMLASEHSETYALAAPRGEAKSTIVTRLFSLYCIVSQRKRYIAIISNTYEQAAEFLAAIKTELEENTRLKIDFPEAFGMGEIWQEGKIVTRNQIKVQVAGAAKSLRGFVHGAYRPDLVILDDLENDKNVESPSQRDKLQNWINSTVLKLGAVGEKFDVFYIGTILHHDSVLNRILKNKGWKTRLFKALIRYPDNMQLWDEYEAIFHAEGKDCAAEFYYQNQSEMDKGAIVSWQSRPLLELMFLRARDGHKTFDTELQNDPTAGEDAPFHDSIRYWHALPQGLLYFGACDPSLGKHGASRDPSAIVIGAYDRKTGVMYIVKADIKKRVPDRIISDIIHYQKQFHCHLWAIESVQFQEFFRTELVKRSAESGVPVPAVPVRPHSDKVLRIESLQPHMANGLILLHHEQSSLINQFRHFPKADHDDGCDAVEMVWQLALQRGEKGNNQAFHIPEPSMYGYS